MTTKDFDDRALPPGRIDAPPPSAQLLNEIQEMKPVVMRTRFGALTAVAASGLFTAAMVLVRGSHRPDLGALPITWVITAASLWGLSFALPLLRRLCPGGRRAIGASARVPHRRPGARRAVSLHAVRQRAGPGRQPSTRRRAHVTPTFLFSLRRFHLQDGGVAVLDRGRVLAARSGTCRRRANRDGARRGGRRAGGLGPRFHLSIRRNGSRRARPRRGDNPRRGHRCGARSLG